MDSVVEATIDVVTVEDERDVVAAHLAQLRLIGTDHLLALIGDRAGHLGALAQQ